MKRSLAANGFTIVELLAALAILAFGIHALINLKLTLHERQARQLEQLSVITHESNALALLRRVNPASEPVGTRALSGTVVLTWQARPTGPAARQLSWAGRETPATLTVYSVEYRIVERGAPIARSTIELLGREQSVSSRNP